MIISHKNLRTLTKEIVTAAGSIGDEPQLVSDNLVEANLAGHDLSLIHISEPTRPY